MAHCGNGPAHSVPGAIYEQSLWVLKLAGIPQVSIGTAHAGKAVPTLIVQKYLKALSRNTRSALRGSEVPVFKAP